MLVVAAAAAAGAVRVAGGASVVGSWELAVGASAVSALALGLPALAFVLERGRATPGWVLMLGAVGGALPLPLLGLSGVIGLYVRAGNWERVAWALDRGIPIPAAGIIFWARFARIEAQAMLVGFTCALIFWLVMIRARPGTRMVNALLALVALGALMVVASLLR